MKFIKSVFILLVLVSAFYTNPSIDIFAKYYVDNNSSEISIIDDAMQKVVENKAVRNNYYLFSIYTIDDNKYLGIYDHFFILD